MTTYERKVRALETEGLTRSDAQGVVDAQEIKIKANGLDLLTDKIMRQAVAKFIFPRLRDFRLYKVRRSEWRSRVGAEVVKLKLFKADDFVKHWEAFEADGLI